MELETFLRENRKSIAKAWTDAVFLSYGVDSGRFLRKEKNSFANPVGTTISRDIAALYDEITGGNDREKISGALDNIIRIRAVQDLDPSQAVGFVLQLREIIRDALPKEQMSEQDSRALRSLEQTIDDTALLAFDIYSSCRKKLYDIRVREVKQHVGRLLKRANLISEIPDPEDGPGVGENG